MSMLKNIQEQPQHIREIMFGLCVVITVSLVGAVWFKDFQKDMYVLLNPEEVQEERFLAQENSESLFGALGQTLGDMSSIFTDLWGSGSSGDEATIEVENKTSDRVYLLPLSEEK